MWKNSIYQNKNKMQFYEKGVYEELKYRSQSQNKKNNMISAYNGDHQYIVNNNILMSQNKGVWHNNIALQGTKQPGFTHIYRNSSALDELISTPIPGVNNLKELYLDLFLKKYSQKKFLGRIQVDTVQEDGQIVQKRSIQNVLTYREGFDIATRLASSLLKNKLIYEETQEGMQMIEIYSRNRQQFYLSDLACILYGITCVPLYDTLGIDNLSYCLAHSNISTCICSASNAKILLGLSDTANLQNLVLCDPLEPSLEEELKKKFNIFYYWRLIESVKLEEILDYTQFSVTPEQCFTFSYTSGTTGPPKAAMLSQNNFLAFIAGLKIALTNLDRNSQDQVHLSILPMPHAYQRIILAYQILLGSFIVPSTGNLQKIKDDMALVRPTQLICVPRLYNRMLQGIFESLGGEENTIKLLQQNDPIFQKIRQGFGGRIKYMLTGSAPIGKKVIQLLGKIMAVPFLEGYGQTQCTGGAFIQNIGDKQYGRIGVVWSCLQFKLSDIPQMGYTSEDRDSQNNLTPRGEIWVRGHEVILGYYKKPELTNQAITKDGWLKTGDVEALSPFTNTMQIIDRKKNIFKLSQGEYVSCEKVEFFYLRSIYITQAFLHGDSLQNFAVVIVVPNKLELQKLGKELGIEKPYAELCEDKIILRELLKNLTHCGLQAKLNSFEQAKNIRIEPEAFALRGIVSSTMKLQRFEARKYYKKQIDEMYSEGPLNNLI